MVQTPPNYFNPEILARLEGLALRARMIVEGYVSGLHRSPYRGFSIEFAEHREYAPGDDLRYLDWKVFGRTDKLYLKQFEEETNQVCYLAVDSSESMAYRSPTAVMSKLDYAQTAAAALAYLILRQQDAVGLVTYDNQVRSIVPPSSALSHVDRLAHVMDRATAEKKTDTGRIFHDLAERFTRRGLVVILSDLFDDVERMTAGLHHFRHRRHDVIVLHVLDPAELDFPFREVTLFHGLESAPDLLVDPRGVRRAYLKQFDQFQRKVKRACRMHQIDYVPLRTDQPLDVVLSSYLSHRMMRG